MPNRQFQSYRSYFDFARSVKMSWRYCLDDTKCEFIKTLIALAADRIKPICKNKKVWRAQHGHRWDKQDLGGGVIDEVPGQFDLSRMKPLQYSAHEGRANPKGIPYLYVATNEKTAVAEVRPWIGSYVSVGGFRTTRDLQIINLTTDDKRSMVYLEEPTPPERTKAVWRDIDRAFAEPTTRSDDFAEYAPTQIISEVFKKEGFDGVAYRSSLGSGYNIVLFELDSAELFMCSLVQVKAVDLGYEETCNPYFIKQSDTTTRKPDKF